MRQVRPNVPSRAETRSTRENDVVLTDRPIRSQNRLVEILVRMMVSSAAASPLHDDREISVRGRDVDDLSDAINRAVLNATCQIPAAFSPSMISTACSAAGIFL
jgi:hypothetical protein